MCMDVDQSTLIDHRIIPFNMQKISHDGSNGLKPDAPQALVHL